MKKLLFLIGLSLLVAGRLVEAAEQEPQPDSSEETRKIARWAQKYADKKSDDIAQHRTGFRDLSNQEAREKIKMLSIKMRNDFNMNANVVLGPLFTKYLALTYMLEDLAGTKNFDRAEKAKVDELIQETRNHLMSFMSLIPDLGSTVTTAKFSRYD